MSDKLLSDIKQQRFEDYNKIYKKITSLQYITEDIEKQKQANEISDLKIGRASCRERV